MTSLFSLLPALLTPQAFADCGAPVALGALVDAVEAAEDAFSDLTGRRDFTAAFEDAQAALICLGEAVDPEAAARFHRLQGLAIFPDDPGRAAASFAAARQLEPAYAFPEALVPQGAPQREAYGAVDLSVGRYLPLTSPEVGRVWFDGRTVLERPTDWPTIYQREAGGRILETAYVWQGEPTPSAVLQPWELPSGAYRPPVDPVDPSAAPGVAPEPARAGRSPRLGAVTAMKSPPLPPLLGLAAAGGLLVGVGSGYHFYESDGGLDAGWERDPYTLITPAWIGGGALLAVGGAGMGWKAVADRGGGAGLLEAGGYAALAGGGVLFGQAIGYWDYTRRAGEVLDDERELLLGVGGTMMLTGAVSAVVGQRLADRRRRAR